MNKGLVHNYELVNEAIQLVKQGKKSFYSQYLLNPSIEPDDIKIVLYTLLCLLSIRFILVGAHHKKLSHIPSIFRILFSPISKAKRESKLCENLWYTLWHTFSFCFGVYVLMTESLTVEKPGWFRLLLRDYDLKWYWFPTAAEQATGNTGWPLFYMSYLIKTYYLTELAFWLSCGIYLSFESIRDDFYALLLHHTLTCVLIILSYTLSFWRIGTVILVTHDIADIILYTAKTIHYSNCPNWIVDCVFMVFVIGFFISRLVLFPIFCVRPVLDLRNLAVWSKGIIVSHWQVPGGIILPCSLCILQMLHIFWFVLILKMVRRAIYGVKASQEGDIRSEDERSDSEKEKSDDESSSNEDTISREMHERMKISSLPGVRATLSKRELRHPKATHSKKK